MRLPVTGVVAAQTVAASATLALILLAYGGWVGFAEGFDPACAEPVCDFQRHYVPTARALFDTGAPTWGYVYPATLAVLTWPLAWGALGTLLWSVAVGVVQVVLAVLPPHLVRDTPAPLAIAFSVVSMLGVAGLQVLSWGQVSGMLVLAGVMGLWLVSRRPILGGVLVGFGIGVKIYPIVLLPWLIARGRVRAALGVLVTVVLIAGVLPLWALGPGGFLDFHLGVYAEIQRLIPDFQRSIGPQSALSVSERLLLGGPSPLRPLFTAVYALLGLAQLGLLWRVSKRPAADAWLWAFVVTYGTFPLFLASSWLHYFVHLPLVWLLLARAIALGQPEHRLGVWVCMGLSLVLGVWPAWLALGTTLYPALGAMLASHVVGFAGLVLVLIDEEFVQGPTSPVDTPATNR